MKHAIILIMVTLMVAWADAKMDLATVPERDSVQLTIYNSADLTLARETRDLTFQAGDNKLQFSWANTLIDPTSLQMLPKAYAGQIYITDLTFPPRSRNLGLWNIQSDISGNVPVEISYLTSGLSWRAFYMATLSEDEQSMRLDGYVRIANNSGEDYANAQVRLVVGKIHTLDEIADLARRTHPYGRPGEPRTLPARGFGVEAARFAYDSLAGEQSKEIEKRGLSEYFLYTIEGTETIPHGWSKRLLSFEAEEIPVTNLYKYEQNRYGDSVMHFLSFANDSGHNLGNTPIPGGDLQVYRGLDDGHLSYRGRSSFRYIPVGEEIELNLGPAQRVIVEPTLMNYQTGQHRFNDAGDLVGWDEMRDFDVAVSNSRDIPVKVQVRRNFDTNYWDLSHSGDFDEYERIDSRTVEFTLTLEPGARRRFSYNLRTYHGRRENDWQPE